MLLFLPIALAFLSGCQGDTADLPPPVADFSADVDAGDAPLRVQFRDDTVSPAGIDSWAWDFGDGGTSTEQHPVHIYTVGGTYTVSLTVTAPSGTDTAVKVDGIHHDRHGR
jgi:PKD repeat protein